MSPEPHWYSPTSPRLVLGNSVPLKINGSRGCKTEISSQEDWHQCKMEAKIMFIVKLIETKYIGCVQGAKLGGSPVFSRKTSFDSSSPGSPSLSRSNVTVPHVAANPLWIPIPPVEARIFFLSRECRSNFCFPAASQ